MFVLRIITTDKDGSYSYSNQKLGDQYEVVDVVEGGKRFEEIYNRIFNGEKDQPEVSSFVIVDEITYPVYTNQTAYIMFENGSTFEKLAIVYGVLK